MFARIPKIASANTLRQFSTSVPALSNVGKQPIRLTEGVTASIESIPHEFCKTFTKGNQRYVLDRQVVIAGPRGTLKTPIPGFVKVDNANNNLAVSVEDSTSKVQRSLWGTYRALLNNNAIGASEGHLAVVRFVGTGYRAILEKDAKGNDIVSLKLGIPSTPQLRIPKGLTVTSPIPTRLVIEGTDLQQVKLFAAKIRAFKKPEPYKGKGIFIDDETIQLKEKKIK
ncbi:uncharacterized protein SPAPADRAFT_134512 [Spathaspora passalidarum NRRL Y-27907]|uniref:Large ribosomal subunit protein uL6 alpha-beta domain-containing protein n=1 Tax=Spathaspora passalidarum (strain NRRL Y-27907 / 11-Y1) TaxID=619300 RepID=G3AJA5_SPAPN|nr:uncharacterized protein SPAPADRAFT_134512 [Spathaspora passalidarum NRRL Y-27907]EGW34564.1 hypothetical protein SPAPADRAFT_134512 [Spathaspora passalidarum NRRL Y-27907]